MPSRKRKPEGRMQIFPLHASSFLSLVRPTVCFFCPLLFLSCSILKPEMTPISISILWSFTSLQNFSVTPASSTALSRVPSSTNPHPGSPPFVTLSPIDSLRDLQGVQLGALVCVGEGVEDGDEEVLLSIHLHLQLSNCAGNNLSRLLKSLKDVELCYFLEVAVCVELLDDGPVHVGQDFLSLIRDAFRSCESSAHLHLAGCLAGRGRQRRYAVPIQRRRRQSRLS
mmetsp:Transcript_3071/g.6262  ORF Transcript_3071/g.6262 Transcript_3071/m.6262 type:complete len:226 (+) Transcript_3071:615-1292(+)